MVSLAVNGDIVSWLLVGRALVGFATDGFALDAVQNNPKIIKAGEVEGAFAATLKFYRFEEVFRFVAGGPISACIYGGLLNQRRAVE